MIVFLKGIRNFVIFGVGMFTLGIMDMGDNGNRLAKLHDKLFKGEQNAEQKDDKQS